ncbi:DUF3052 domain-containing protein [Streptomyces sp. NPDC058052]|uniref:DUF3052 domain-containing protein n=1 Tax=Streptomyces sp. NPDC058052 TaxID=3346316 RepID=UPI0036E8A5BA
MAAVHAERMDLRAGQVVREIGWDDDTDPAIRDDVRQATGSALLDGDVEVTADVVLYWWRNGDGDLASELLHDVGALSDGGTIWVLTPKAGRPGHCPAEDVTEAAADAGRRHTTTVGLGAWDGHRIEARPSGP